MTLKESINYGLGTGIYTVPDIAFVLGLPRNIVRPFLKEFLSGKLGRDYNEDTCGKGRERVVNFPTLIEFYVFYHLRTLKVSPKKIFIAYHHIAKQFNTVFPFAISKVLSEEQNEVFVFINETTLNLDCKKLSAFKATIEAFCKKIEFSKADIADCYYPLGRGSHIVVDPHHQFGQPTIEHTNLLAENIYNLSQAGETNDFLSRLYNVTLKEIEDAITFFTPKIAA